MNVGPESYASRRDTVAFVFCLLLAVVARADPLNVSDDVASGIRQTLLRPMLALQQQTEVVRGSRAAFQQVVMERDSAAVLAAELPRVLAENQRLRAMLGLANREPMRHVAADVLHQVQRGDMTTLIVTAGSEDGVIRWAPVVAPAGLVGHVHAVDRTTAVVNAWTHPDFAASATTEDGETVGIVVPRTGRGPTTSLELRYVVHRSALAPGAWIVTSGLGGVYPRGLRIGRVRELVTEQVGLSETYQLDPAVHPAAVSHVLIILPEPETETRNGAPDPPGEDAPS